MKCEFCGSYIKSDPHGGNCPNCGAVLPARPSEPAPATVVIRQPYAAVPPQPGITCCPRCYSTGIRFKKQGFRWGLALLGLFLLPPFGLLFGLIGRNDLRYSCSACSYRWKR